MISENPKAKKLQEIMNGVFELVRQAQTEMSGLFNDKEVLRGFEIETIQLHVEKIEQLNKESFYLGRDLKKAKDESRDRLKRINTLEKRLRASQEQKTRAQEVYDKIIALLNQPDENFSLEDFWSYLIEIGVTERALKSDNSKENLPEYSDFYKKPIKYGNGFFSEFYKFSSDDQKSIANGIEKFAANGADYQSLRTKRIDYATKQSGMDPFVSYATLRVRFTWAFTKNAIEIFEISPRKEVYKKGNKKKNKLRMPR